MLWVKTHKMAPEASWHQNCVTVTLYIHLTQTQTDRPMQCPSPNIFVVQSLIFTARSCASAVYTLALYLSQWRHLGGCGTGGLRTPQGL